MLKRTSYLMRHYGIGPALYSLLRSLYSRIYLSNHIVKSNAQVSIEYPLTKAYLDLRPLHIDLSIPIYINPLDLGLSREILLYGFREPLHMHVLYHVIKLTKPTILDIGSNIGVFPLLEIHAQAKKVIAVEPVPETYRYLKANLSKINNVVLLQVAIDIKNGYTDMYIPSSSFYGDKSKYKMYNWATLLPNILPHQEDITKIIVECVSLDSMIKKYSPSMLRMDIEGYEWKILRLSKNINSIEVIDVELHNFLTIPFKYIEETLVKLRNQGFRQGIVIKDISPMSAFDSLIIRKFGLFGAVKILKRLFKVNNTPFDIWIKVIDVNNLIPYLKTNRPLVAHTILINQDKVKIKHIISIIRRYRAKILNLG